MRKTLLALLFWSLAVPTFTARAEQLLADANTNFEPARKSTDAEPPAPRTVAPAAARTGSSEASQAAQEEVLRRQAAQIAGRALLDEGQKLYYDGKYAQAIVKLEQAIHTIPRAKATEVDYNRALNALTDSYYKLGTAAFRTGDNSRARDYAMKALEVDPKNRNAEILLVNVRKVEVAGKSAVPAAQAERPRPDKTPEFTAKKDEARRLFREGKILMNSGQYDEAEKRFQQILLLDPYNEDAYILLDEVTARRMPSTVEGSEAARNRMLWQADNAWVPPISGEVRLPVAGADSGPLSARSAASTIILRKLNDIIFPEIKFREATIIDVVQFLSEESRRLDSPSHEGVNIVLGSGIAGEAATPAEGAAPAAASAGSRPITLSLRNVPMIEALKYITSLANLKYRVESSAVLVLPADAPDSAMTTRTYPVTPGAFSRILTAPAAGGAEKRAGGEGYVAIGGSTSTAGSLDVKELFTGAGVPFPPGSSIIYNERTSTLIVRNTAESIEALERVLPAFIDIPKQVEIEAKFVEISQSDLDELGFKWKVGQRSFNVPGQGGYTAEGGSPSTIFPGGVANPLNSDSISRGLRDSTSIQGSAIDAVLAGTGFGAVSTLNSQVASLRGIVENAQFELIINALAQKKSTDLLSAPKVTTISGVQAQVKVVQEFIYPTEFSEPQTGNGGITPSIPSSFKTREVGVVLNVTPTVGADGNTINLTLIPEVSEFLGFLDYSPGTVIGTTTNGTISVPFKIQQPLFSSRNLTTSIVIWDGQTVVLGGLIREDVQKFDDKIPFLGDIPILGRLFRSKVTNRIKRNLLIFVSARLIDPAGNPIHKENVRASSR